MFSSSTFGDGRHIPPGFMVFGTAGATSPRWQVVSGSPPTTVASAAAFNNAAWYQGINVRGRIIISPYSSLRYHFLAFTSQALSFRDIIYPDGQAIDPNFYGGKIQYGNGVLMNLYTAANSTVATDLSISTDLGATWTKKVGVLPANYAWGHLGGLAYNPNNLAWGTIPYSTISPQAATNICRYSTDNGTTWQAGGNFPSSQYWLDLCYANNKWIALGNGASYYSSSSTMASWTQITVPSGGPVTAYKCKYKNGIFMVVGGTWNGTIYTAGAMTSTDGITFTAKSTGLPSNFILRDVDYGNGYWVAVGQATSGSSAVNTQTYYYSNNDGASWTAGTLNVSLSWLGVIYGDSKWDQTPSNSYSGRMIGLGVSAVSTSADLLPTYALGKNTTWTPATTTPSIFLGANSESWYSYTRAVSDGTTALVVNGLTGYTASTTDGVTWTAKTRTPLYNGNRRWMGLIRGGAGRIVAVLGGSNIWASTEAMYTDDFGATWTLINTLPSGKWCQVAYGNGRWVAIDFYTPAATIYTEDGVTWVTGGSCPLGLPTQEFSNSFFFAGGTVNKFLNVRELNYDTVGVAQSSDGVTWTSNSVTVPGISIISTPFSAFNSQFNRLVMIQSYSNNVWYSNDVGATWTNVTTPFVAGKLAFTGLYYFNGVFIATTKTASGQTSTTYISSDGITWTDGVATSTGISNNGPLTFLSS